MANSLYARGKQRMLEKLISFKDDDIQAHIRPVPRNPRHQGGDALQPTARQCGVVEHGL